MPGAELPCLRDRLALAIEGRLDAVLGRVGDHQRPLRIERMRRGHRPEQHGPTGHGVEHFRDPRVHPHSPTGGEHHHRDAPARLRRCWPFGPRGSVSAHGEVAAYFSLGLHGDLPARLLLRSALVIQIDAERRRYLRSNSHARRRGPGGFVACRSGLRRSRWMGRRIGQRSRPCHRTTGH